MFEKYLNQVKENGVDMSKTQTSGSGGSSYTPPVPGTAGLRLGAYIETGKHKEVFNGEAKIKDKAVLVFELSGKNYPQREINGELVPQTITVIENISQHEKSNFHKLFLMMANGDNSITHMAEMIGKPFIGKVFNRKTKDGQRTYATLKDSSGYHIGPAVKEDPMTGEVKQLPVPELQREPKLFLWSYCDKEMWDNIYIAGEINGNSRNIFQDKIRNAVNFKNSRIFNILKQDNETDTEELESMAQENIESNKPNHFVPKTSSERDTRPTFKPKQDQQEDEFFEDFDDSPFG